ncbi:MAG: hypothetical protein RL264_1691 [Bacteroidota bacterium]|jgi:L-asparaginase
MKKILLVYTGGTIGMMKDPKTGELKSVNFDYLYDHVPELSRLQVKLEVHSFSQPIDSSEINLRHWIKLAKLIAENYEKYDGFVLLHGSDTMAFTASMLSFMLQGIRKPIILTGSQLPIGTIRTDGKENLITAVEIAADVNEKGEPVVQEVAVYFEYSLYRGNRSSKVSANQFAAFQSPNYSPLAVAGVNIIYAKDKLFRTALTKTDFHFSLSNEVGVVRLFPGMNPLIYKDVFDFSKVKAVVLETFGAGNAPSSPDLQGLISAFISAGGLVLNITQCSSGAVKQGAYATSSFLQSVGVISGNDLTAEAAITKLQFLLGKFSDIEVVKQAIATNLVGELGA